MAAAAALARPAVATAGGAVPAPQTNAAARPATTVAPAKPAVPRGPGYTFIHDVVARVPWSIHIVKIERNRPNLELDTTLGHGATLGISVVSEQMQLIAPELGRPVAAVNGDMFQSNYTYAGDPDGLQIMHGEVVSAPHPSRVCFWVDGQGNPHRTNVQSLFHVTWPDGTATPMGLNEERESDMAVLYTSAVGPSTRTYGGREILLVAPTNSPWQPLQIGRTCPMLVKTVSETGNSPVPRQAMVLSLGNRLAGRVPKVAPGAVIQVSTATLPSLAGARTGIGGGPSLVCGGKPWQWPGFFHMRHPRSAVGWNKDYFFLIVVDGRQIGSIGMSFAELADYMIHKLGCEEAMNLDGGGSATLWVDGRVVNTPSQGYERPGANSLMLVDRARK